MATQHMAEIGELQLQLGIPPRAGRNGIMDATPMWWSMAAKKTLARMGTKHVNAKTTGHERKRFSVALAGFDNNQVCIPMVTFKGLKKVPREVHNREDVFVTVSKGGSMTPELMQQWIRKVWAKRPTRTPFRLPNILGMDGHYSHVHPEVLDTLKTVCNTTVKISPPSMTGITNGPDTRWNKVFKHYMRELMEEYLDTEEYKVHNHRQDETSNVLQNLRLGSGSLE